MKRTWKCRLAEWLGVLWEERRAPSFLERWRAKHLARCGRCRAEAAAARNLAERLRAAAPAARRAPEPALVAALHARRKAERAVRLEPAAAGLPRRAAPALAAAAFAAFALLLTLLWRPERSDPVERLADMLVRGEVWERVAPLETNALPGLVARAQAPLHEELQAVVRDARAAAESVIESCLPPRVRKDFAPAPPEAAPRRR